MHNKEWIIASFCNVISCYSLIWLQSDSELRRLKWHLCSCILLRQVLLTGFTYPNVGNQDKRLSETWTSLLDSDGLQLQECFYSAVDSVVFKAAYTHKPQAATGEITTGDRKWAGKVKLFSTSTWATEATTSESVEYSWLTFDLSLISQPLVSNLEPNLLRNRFLE